MTDIHHFLYGLESTASEDVTGLSDLSMFRKVPSSGASGSLSSPKLVD